MKHRHRIRTARWPWWQRVALVCLCLIPASLPVSAHPALWVARDADTTVYLFGTVHILSDHIDWHFPALDKALEASDALYVEVPADETDKGTMQGLVLRYGLDPAHPLSNKLSDSENTLLAKAAVQAGLPGGKAALQPMKPWLAALTLSVAPLLKAGMDPELGVDKLLQARMKKAGKPIHGLETAERQIRILADLPESVQLALLRSTLHDFAHARAELSAIVDAWLDGDTQHIASLMAEQMQKQSKALYETLLVDRNRQWAQDIATLMHDRPGTVFVAVGAAHLAGPDRVQAQLQRLGIVTHTVRQVHRRLYQQKPPHLTE